MAENEAASEQIEEAATTEAEQGGELAHAEGAATATAVPESPFDKADLQQFEDDDITAGRSICKMLSLLFIYTLIAMSIVSYWTWVVSTD